MAGQRKWMEIALSVAEGALQLAKVPPDAAGAFAAFRAAYGSYSDVEYTADALARMLWEETAATGTLIAIDESDITQFLTKAEVADAIGEFIAPALKMSGSFGTAEHLIDPAGFEGAALLRDRFPDFIQWVTPITLKPDNTLSPARLDDCLRRALQQAWSRHHELYAKLIARLDGPVAEGVRREAAWMAHYNWVRSKFETQRVFSPGGDIDVTIEQVFTPLRACRHERVKVADEMSDREGARRLTKKVAHVGWLQRAMEEWLADGEASPIRIITGGPGCGKSSFARSFACHMFRRRGWRIVFVELQHMRLSGSLASDIAGHLTNADAGPGLGGDPLGSRRAGSEPMLLIFDGLDELAHREGAAVELATDFIRDLKMLLSQRTAPPVRALVLGRPAAVEEARRKAKLAEDTLFTVLPLRRPREEDLTIEGERFEGHGPVETEVSDPEGVMEDSAMGARDGDHRFAYWERWCRANGMECCEPPEGLLDEALEDLTAEPLLLHLLLISGAPTAERFRAAAENRNVIYRDIFAQVHARDEREDKPGGRLSAEAFAVLMECLGLAAWPHGGRAGDRKVFKALREHHASGAVMEEIEALEGLDLRSVAVMFYTRVEYGEDTFEFIHKSFGDYLVARALWRHAARCARKIGEDGKKSAALQWVGITTGAALTHEIIAALRNEARLTPEGEAIKRLRALEKLMDWSLEHGMPVLEGAQSYREAEARQAHAEGALLAVLNACALRIEDRETALVRLRLEDHLTVRRMIERLGINDEAYAPLGRCLGRLVLSTMETRAFLHRLLLGGANLSGANLSGANLSGANLSGANLSGANLSGANLSGAELSGAELSRANLSWADLSGADLSGADLSGADLSGANLSGADLSGADLSGADLSGANLSGAELSGANCRRVRIDSGRLQFADCSQAQHLSQEAVNAAQGNSRTALPDGLTRPAHWPETKYGSWQEAVLADDPDG